MARALDAYGAEEIVDGAKKAHPWRSGSPGGWCRCRARSTAPGPT
jgi:hypothetical protein